ncbi:sigma-70 family RNA polymerase sigma factor [soil metagenome]
MLGSISEADDAVQESWLRLSRTDTSEIENLGGWLTTITSRVCLDMLRSRKSRREDSLNISAVEPIASGEKGSDPEHEAILADSVGLAMLVVLETLTPTERLAFVLHDMFAVPFDEIAPIVGRTPDAARQLASRARRRVQGSDPDSEVDRDRQREMVEAFLAAAREGNFAALLALLDPDIVVRSDAAAAQYGSSLEMVGAHSVAEFFNGRAQAAFPASIDGKPGAAWIHRGEARVVFSFTFVDDRISAIDLIADTTQFKEINFEIPSRRVGEDVSS